MMATPFAEQPFFSLDVGGHMQKALHESPRVFDFVSQPRFKVAWPKYCSPRCSRLPGDFG
jgi:hypothetical protein